MLTLGCISFSPLAIAVILGVMAIGALGCTFFLYLPLMLGVKALANGPLVGKPLALFGAALLGAAALSGAGSLANHWLAQHPHGREAGVLGILLLSGAGMLGWTLLLGRWYTERQKRKAEERLMQIRGEALPPKPRFQVWFQDLWVAALCYAAGLALSNQWAVHAELETKEFLLVAAYLFGAGAIGLFVAVDVCRRSEHGQQGLKRAGIFTGIFTLFPVTLPVAIPAWWVWRRALKAQA